MGSPDWGRHKIRENIFGGDTKLGKKFFLKDYLTQYNGSQSEEQTKLFVQHNLMITREGLILTLSIQMYFLIYPKGWINDERMAVHCGEKGDIFSEKLRIKRFPEGPRDFPRVKPDGNLEVGQDRMYI